MTTEAMRMRYAAVPWLSNSDFLPAGPAEWAVHMLDTIALGWVVRHPLNHEDRIMVIRATRGNGNDGGVVTLALTDSLEIDTSAVRVHNTQHSRTFHDDSHDLSDDDDAA